MLMGDAHRELFPVPVPLLCLSSRSSRDPSCTELPSELAKWSPSDMLAGAVSTTEPSSADSSSSSMATSALFECRRRDSCAVREFSKEGGEPAEGLPALSGDPGETLGGELRAALVGDCEVLEEAFECFTACTMYSMPYSSTRMMGSLRNTRASNHISSRVMGLLVAELGTVIRPDILWPERGGVTRGLFRGNESREKPLSWPVSFDANWCVLCTGDFELIC